MKKEDDTSQHSISKQESKSINTNHGVSADLSDGAGGESPTKKSPLKERQDKTMLDWFEFETRIRKTVFELVDPNVQETILHGGKINDLKFLSDNNSE